MAKKFVVTITRQFGSMGRPIAREMSERLGIEYYDRDIVEENGMDASMAINCPNCGAPLKMLGAKKCEYCGSPVLEFNIKVWNFDSVEEG